MFIGTYIQKRTSGTNADTTNPKSIIESKAQIAAISICPFDATRATFTCRKGKPPILRIFSDAFLFSLFRGSHRATWVFGTDTNAKQQTEET